MITIHEGCCNIIIMKKLSKNDLNSGVFKVGHSNIFNVVVYISLVNV